MSETKVTPPPADQPKCPQCGTPLPTGALAGLCPVCLLKMGAADDTVTDGKQPPFNPPSVAELAAKFPQLEILELIGKGGMGAVYKARQKQLDRIVALKILPPGIGHDAAFAGRFAREAKALAKLNHPNIVTLYEFGEASGQFYFLMEFVDGVNLRQLLQAGRISSHEALAIVPQICDALQFAHDQGIVHRDIKPENILMDRRGRVKVADFGLAKIIGGEGEPAGGAYAAGSTSLTDAGKVMGTPQYMSPEQIIAPGEVDHRADIYALGVVFYQMLTGELPGKRIAPPSTKVHIDVRLDEIVLRALEKNPELRYQQVSEVRTMVETIVSDNEKSEIGSQKPEVEPRLSRTAITGALLPLLLCPFLASAFGFAAEMDRHFSSWPRWQVLKVLLVQPTVFFLTVVAVLGTTILGWIAVSQIRRSSGKIYGLGLAVFDGLFFPLLALDCIIGWISYRVLWALNFRPGINMENSAMILVWLVILAASIVADSLIIWLVWRAVKKPIRRPIAAEATAKSSTGKTVAIGCAVLLLGGMALVVVLALSFIGYANVRHKEAIQVEAGADSTAAPQPTAQELSAGLVGLWSGEGNAIDSISGSAGENQNVTYTDGLVGRAFAFNPDKFSYGTYTGIRVADRPEFALTNSLTIAGWVRPRGDGYIIFWRGDHRPGLDPYCLSMETNHDLRFSIGNEDGLGAMVDADIPYDEWTHVTATLDRDTAYTRLRIYTNGVQVAQAMTDIRPFGRLLPDQSLGVGIGNLNDGGNTFPFLGDLDEIALYNRALSEDEVRALYNLEQGGGKILATASKAGQKPGAQTSFTFGPLLERVISEKEANDQGLVFFDFETGNRLPPPFPLLLRSDQGPAFVELSTELLQWVKSNRMDALIQFTPTGWNVMNFRMQEDFIAQAGDWDSVTADRVADVFAVKDAAGLVRDEVPASSFGHPFDDRRDDCKAFRTRSNTMGVMQWTGLKTTPHGVKIRYKLVQGSDTARRAQPAVTRRISVLPLPDEPASRNKFSNSAAFNPSPGLLELKQKWPPGKCYIMDLNFKQNTALLLRGRTNSIMEDVTIGNQFGLTVLPEAANGGHELELEFLGARMGIKLGDDTLLDYNSANKSATDQTSGTAAVFEKVVGSKIRYFLNASNDAERLEGVAGLVQRIKSVPQTDPLTTDLKNIFDAAFFEAFTNASPFLPDQAVQPGDTWSSHFEHPVTGTGIEVWDCKVIFQNWEMHENHQCARLELQGIMKIKPDPTSKRDEKVYHSRDGVSQGVAWFDPELGQIIEADMKKDINVDKKTSVNPDGTPIASKQMQTITTQRHQIYTLKLVQTKTADGL